MALTHGTRLGPYEIGALLGVGGMGEVYRARDSRLDRTGRDQGPAAVARGRCRSARAFSERSGSARLPKSSEHRRGLEEADGLHDFVVEPVEGETLAERLERGGALPANEALRIVRQMAEAPGAAHEKGWSERICREESDNDSVLRLT